MTDLFATLHDRVDSAPAGVPPTFDLVTVRSRARRRRVTLHAARSAVGVGAAGAVALGGLQLAGRDSSGLPPARADAPTGTCGSDAAALAGVGADHHLALGARSGDGLATGSPDAAEDGVPLTRAVGESVELWLDTSGTATSTGPVASDGVPTVVRVLLVRDGRVVGTSRHTAARSTVAPYGALTSAPFDVPLRTCDQPGRAGGDLLPPGDYAVYVAADDGPLTAPVESAAGPWTVRVADRTPVAGVPAGFPDDVPLVPGRLVDGRLLDDGTWYVEVAVAADDRLEAAAALLGAPDTGEPTALGDDNRYVQTGDRWVLLVRSEVRGEDTVLYLVNPPH
ncbi:hypothetical protein [Cellulomonas fimi]|uniref:Uncharacterized protein n=1 Tax=Cellulomonas fimi (strain ATCC 484 / DSM 20113 / JCM 1341 / CCUG 24087 / LMG 16345 / NBRC 15513 / NCIMB 8980 / NCTC 7547 / NRS-133) TaxID=590998 RepID=F4H0L6_CELFA|nr:hypothetical protein [Cellulomonas fimi]AEE44989.1 hypothetical protein Celf_0851 [Cellulomonas fimi ATCC 484]NNH08970.1 hypothetical protein [Cellulomonas fimi]VEH27900.1 Uncharacterised protein [Cellulomonas fimi]